MMKRLLLFFACTLFLFGCTTTEKGTAIGTVTGAGIGGIIGHQSGHGAEGAAIGGAIGALGGYAVGEKMKGKFCPTGGKQYDNSLVYCPVHGVELQPIQK